MTIIIDESLVRERHPQEYELAQQNFAAKRKRKASKSDAEPVVWTYHTSVWIGGPGKIMNLGDLLNMKDDEENAESSLLDDRIADELSRTTTTLWATQGRRWERFTLTMNPLEVEAGMREYMEERDARSREIAAMSEEERMQGVEDALRALTGMPGFVHLQVRSIR